MRDVLDQIKKGLESNHYYLCLFVCLAIPDICGAIDSKDGKASGNKYKVWFDKYAGSKYSGKFTGSDCYYFRCSLLHQGSTQHPKSRYSRILMAEPSSNFFHKNVLDDVLNIEIKKFCLDIISGVEEWLCKVEETERFKTNFDKFVHRYPQGLPPYLVGVHLVA